MIGLGGLSTRLLEQIADAAMLACVVEMCVDSLYHIAAVQVCCCVELHLSQ